MCPRGAAGQRHAGRHNEPMPPLLEVRVLGAADAAPAEAGGADRLVVARLEGEEEFSPEPALVAAVRGRSSLHLRPVLRLRDGYSTDGGEFVRLRGLISAYLDAGADGLVFGFLNGLGDVDAPVIEELLEGFATPWAFSRAVDTCLDQDGAWAALVGLSQLDGVHTAGSARGMEFGMDDVVTRARTDRRIGSLVVADGEVHPDHVPWLARAGVRQFRVDDQVRPGGSRKAYVDADLVRSWRQLLDAEAHHLS